MGARLLFAILFFISAQFSTMFIFASPVWGSLMSDELTSLEVQDDKADSFTPSVQEEGTGTVIVDPNDAAKEKKLIEILKNVIEEAKKCVVQKKPQEDSWAAINKGNKGKSWVGRTKLPTFDFTQVPAGPDQTKLVISNLAALMFCKLPTQSAKRVKVFVASSVSAKPNTGSVFSLGKLNTNETTCASAKANFCQGICTQGLCGGDIVLGAACIQACWMNEKDGFRKNIKIQQCHEEFDARFSGGTAALLNQCAIKKLQYSRGTHLWGSKKANELFDLADLCAKAKTTEGHPTLPPACDKVLKTCELAPNEQQSLKRWADKWNETGSIPSYTVPPPLDGFPAPLGGNSSMMNPFGPPMMGPMGYGMGAPSGQNPFLSGVSGAGGMNYGPSPYGFPQGQGGGNMAQGFGGQSGFGNQNNFGNQGGFWNQGGGGSAQGFGGQGNFGNQNGFGGPNNFGGQGVFGNQNNFGNQGSFGGGVNCDPTQGFVDPSCNGGGNQNGFGGPNNFGGQGGFGNQNNFGNQGGFGTQDGFGGGVNCDPTQGPVDPSCNGGGNQNFGNQGGFGGGGMNCDPSDPTCGGMNCDPSDPSCNNW